MTRGKEVTEAIKASKKTAREFFEEYEWAYSKEQVKSQNGEYLLCDEIIYRDGHKKIVFDLIGKLYFCVANDGEQEAINMDDNKLIQIQLKELGWI